LVLPHKLHPDHDRYQNETYDEDNRSHAEATTRRWLRLLQQFLNDLI
jgi:hypothetical protein